jgi:hypothetical protein
LWEWRSDWIGVRFQPSSQYDNPFDDSDALIPNQQDYSVPSSRHTECNDAQDDEVEGVTLIEVESSEFEKNLNLYVAQKITEELIPDQHELEKQESLEQLETEHTLKVKVVGGAHTDNINFLSVTDSDSELAVDFDARIDRLLDERGYEFCPQPTGFC